MVARAAVVLEVLIPACKHSNRVLGVLAQPFREGPGAVRVRGPPMPRQEKRMGVPEGMGSAHGQVPQALKAQGTLAEVQAER